MLTEQQKEAVRKLYGTMTAKEIAQQLDVSINSVYNFAKKEKLTKPLNPEFEIAERQEQILLGGILGDGSFKKNGTNYYYRESHAVPEADYLKWKYKELKNMSTGKLYDIPARRETQNPQIGMQTVNTPSLTPYAKMTRMEAINKIDELGLIVWMLDDGWCRHNCKSGCYGISAAAFSAEEIDAILEKMKTFGLNGHVIDSKQDISLTTENNKTIKEIAYRYFPKTMDIMKKKINPLVG